MARGDDSNYTFQPVRVVVAAVIFTGLVIWQADLGWAAWLPTLIAMVLIFAGMNVFYNWANIKLNAMGRRAREAGEEF
ncbi:hypothetical protein [Corynebacterium alimapuense]|uniref:Uncharacterized protein n=1 Tax=Corynebacterium alimapuense TaxID=1576874 RepID=A0A3M8K8N8_9CORY|nr:hypothetical protein [Corynebacterium alimapuense]RNE48828.1 hypothetical protein C5L39_05875 [Corynebacterium alimapuense]